MDMASLYRKTGPQALVLRTLMQEKAILRGATQRLGVGSELPGLLIEHGVDPAVLFQEIGVDLSAVNPDLRLPFPKLLHLLHRAVQLTGCDHLGLLCGLRFEWRHHGAIGELMQSAPTLSRAIEDFVSWQPGYSSGAIVYLHRSGTESVVGFGIYTDAMPGAETLYDVIIGVGARMVRLLTNGKVQPIEVHLSRSAPHRRSVYARQLQVPVLFDQDHSGLILDDQAMRTVLPFADPERHRAAIERIERHVNWQGLSQSDRVRHEIRRAMLDAPPRMNAIAARLGVEVRTLHRRLQKEGTSFSGLNDEVRLAVARELLALTKLPIADIAAATGFASASVFSEAFRRWTGATATSLRAKRQNMDDAPAS